MKKKNILVSLLVFTPFLLAACSSQGAPVVSNTPVTPTTVSNPSPAALAEVAKHATSSDCWLIIDGQTYNVTPLILSGMHPGGDKILAGCGKDATEMYHAVSKHASPQAPMNLSKYLVK